MIVLERFEQLKTEILGPDLIVNSLEDVDELHDKFIKLRSALILNGIMDFMPHYRGEQFFGWDINSGIFRSPLEFQDPLTAKQLEKVACQEFEKNVITDGKYLLRNVFYYEEYGKEWDLLFQGQHGGVKTTITDWTAIIQSAAYFAVELSKDPKIEKADGQLWCMLTPLDFILSHTDDNHLKNFYNQNPVSIDQYYIINPSTYLDDMDKRIYEQRMHRQRGRFFISPANVCHMPINKEATLRKYLIRVRIPHDKKKVIREALAKRGMTREYLYVQENEEMKDLAFKVNVNVYKDFNVRN